MASEERSARVFDLYTKHVNPYLARLMAFAGFGVEVEAQGCYIYDDQGRAYLDCLGGYGVFALGHRHPAVVEAVKKQLDRLPLSGKTFFNELQAELAARLAAVTPRAISMTFFSNSGAEAVEAALKFARKATGRHEIVAALGGYHGKTFGALSVTGRKKYREPFEPLLPGVKFVPYGDAGALRQAVGAKTAAVILEPVQGEGGIIVPPEGYLREARLSCDQYGALLIIDEVQTGLGRTGSMFGVDHEGIEPDLMTLAKALGGGVMPIGATCGTADIWERVFSDNPLLHTSTFGGNPLACAAGLATLDVIEREGLVQRAREVGLVLQNALAEVQRAFPKLVVAVRGRGLMLGVEFAMDEVGEITIAQMVKRGLVAAYTLNNPRVIRFEPPLVLTEEQARWVGATFGEALGETAGLLEALAS